MWLHFGATYELLEEPNIGNINPMAIGFIS